MSLKNALPAFEYLLEKGILKKFEYDECLASRDWKSGLALRTPGQALAWSISRRHVSTTLFGLRAEAKNKKEDDGLQQTFSEAEWILRSPGTPSPELTFDLRMIEVRAEEGVDVEALQVLRGLDLIDQALYDQAVQELPAVRTWFGAPSSAIATLGWIVFCLGAMSESDLKALESRVLSEPDFPSALERKKIMAGMLAAADVPKQQMAAAFEDASSSRRLVPLWCRMDPQGAIMVTGVAFVIVAVVCLLMVAMG